MSTGFFRRFARPTEVAAAIAVLVASLASAANGDALIAAKRASADAVATTLDALGELKAFFPEEFGAPANGVADDAPAIQKAIDHIRTGPGRGRIVLATGKTYFLDSQITYCSNLVIDGTGAKVKVGTGFAGLSKPLFKNFTGTDFTAPGTRVASQNVAFVGLEVDGQDAGVDGARVPNANMHGAMIVAGGWTNDSGVDGLLVLNCNLYSFAGAGIMVWKSSNVRIHDNRFKNFFTNETLSIGSGIDLHEVSGASVLGNKITHDALGLSWHGIVALDWDEGCRDVVIAGNSIWKMNGGDGISCEGNAGPGSNLVNSIIGQNTIRECQGQGVGIDFCASVTLHANRISLVLGPAILYTGCTKVSITGNDIDGSGFGGIVGRSGCAAAVIAGNQVDNITYTDENYRGCGIEFADSTLSANTSVVVCENGVRGSEGPAIYVEAYGATIQANRLYNFGTAAALGATLRAGIVAMEHSVVSGNVIRSSGSAHYAISSASSNFPTMGQNDIAGGYLTGYYYIGYRGGVSVNVSATVYKASYDAESDLFTGHFNGVPAGQWKLGDVMYTTVPAAAGFIGSVVTNTVGPVWKTFGAISA